MPPTTIEILQNLIRFDTTNPPGNERDCIAYIQGLLLDAGIESLVLGRTPERTNLVARLKGTGNAPPLLLYGHVDVVTTANQSWKYPPFEGRIVDGYLWGRGALDCKGPVALFLAALLKAKAEGHSLPGDVIFAAVADEENMGSYGVGYLVKEHADLFKGVRYALGEFGGFNLTLAGKRFYPIMIAEKQICAVKATFHGLGGHASMPVHGQAMAKLARTLQILDQRSLPVHITPAVRTMLNAMANALSTPTRLILRQLLNPHLTDFLLNLLGSQASLFAPLLHNTASPTMLQASDKFNVIPGEVSLGLDGRLLPGLKPELMLAELRALLGPDVHLEVEHFEPGPAEPDLGFFASLAHILQTLDPQGIPLPYVLSAVTDARLFSPLGIQTYGFTPLRLPDDFNFTRTIHAADERVPLAALDFGVQAVLQAMMVNR